MTKPNSTGGNDNGNNVDHYQGVVIPPLPTPEPGALPLMMAPLAALIGVRTRRRG